MGKGVYANGMEVAHKAGANKVMCAFPDVCLSPPSPPAGPVPIPYPDTSMAGTLQSGSRSVKIGGQPAALHGQSYYKSSPLGNEAATRSFGSSVVTHQITGKTYFQASSMDVEIEGKKVNRHLDLTTSNHGSQPGATPPFPGLETMSLGGGDGGGTADEDTCACCGGPAHGAAATRPPMSTSEFYAPSSPPITPRKAEGEAMARASAVVASAKADGCADIVVHGQDDGPCAQHYPASAAENKAARAEYDAMMSPLTPDEYFVEKYGPSLGPQIQGRGKAMRDALRSGAVSVAHKTPLAAGGCPVGAGNLTPVTPNCEQHEKALGSVQGTIATFHRRAYGLGK